MSSQARAGTARVRATSSLALLALLGAAPACAQLPAATYAGPSAPVRPTEPCIVTRIVDGDTIHCSGLGSVRFIGMDTPERNQGPAYADATRALGALFAVGDTIQIEPDVEPQDRYQRALRHIWRRGELVNWWMVRDGWAVLLTIPPNVQYAESLVEAQRLARTERRGLWAGSVFDCIPSDHRAGRC